MEAEAVQSFSRYERVFLMENGVISARAGIVMSSVFHAGELMVTVQPEGSVRTEVFAATRLVQASDGSKGRLLLTGVKEEKRKASRRSRVKFAPWKRARVKGTR